MDAKNLEMFIGHPAYYSEKKKAFLFEIDNGEHGGAFFYQMKFKRKVARREFIDIMQKAQASDNRYADIYVQSFRDEHGILDVKPLCPDYLDTLEEEYLMYNPETGQYEIEDDEDDEDEDMEEEDDW